jgi:hypothetical protein
VRDEPRSAGAQRRVVSICVLGRDLHGRVKVDLAPLPSGSDSAQTRPGNGKTVVPKAADVDFYRALDSAQGTIDRLARRNASGQIRNRRPPIAAGISIDSN